MIKKSMYSYSNIPDKNAHRKSNFKIQYHHHNVTFSPFKTLSIYMKYVL